MILGFVTDLVQRLARALDYLFSGGPTIHVSIYLAERALSRMLEEHGEESEEAAVATEKLMQADFARSYLKAAPSDVRKAIRDAHRAGASEEDLRILSLNRELVVKDGLLQVQSHWIMLLLSATMTVVVLVGYVMLCTMVAIAPAPVGAKAGVIATLLAIFSFLYRGWSLFSSRAIQSGRRLRTHLETHRLPTNIVPFGPRIR